MYAIFQQSGIGCSIYNKQRICCSNPACPGDTPDALPKMIWKNREIHSKAQEEQANRLLMHKGKKKSSVHNWNPLWTLDMAYTTQFDTMQH